MPSWPGGRACRAFSCKRGYAVSIIRCENKCTIEEARTAKARTGDRSHELAAWNSAV